MSVYYSNNGQQIAVGPEIARGGEGAVFELPGDVSLCAKTYLKPLSAVQLRKLSIMVADPPSDPMARQNHKSIAWPETLLYADSKKLKCVGFTMPRADGKRFHKAAVYIDQEERLHHFGGGFTWRHSLVVARNIASAVAAIHERGYCVGDINESNILVGGNGLVTLIDCDSFQVKDSSSGAVYRCPVGKDEYTAPELQGKRYSDIDRTDITDAFALGVLFFQLLLSGTHPYAACGRLVDDAPTTADKIRKGIFPYSAGLRDIAPPGYALPFSILHPTLCGLFERCFARGHQNSMARPLSQEWLAAFDAIAVNLKKCSSNGNHYFFDHLKGCPWCERRQKTGEDPFPSSMGMQVQLTDAGQSGASLQDRIEHLRSYVDMALIDGVLTSEEEQSLIDRGLKLHVPKGKIKKLIEEEVRKLGKKRAVSSGTGSGIPKLEMSDTSLTFEGIRLGSVVKKTVTLSNGGGGILSGTIRSNRKWLIVSQAMIDTGRHRQGIEILVNTVGLSLGFRDRGTIEIQSNGGTAAIQVSLSVELPEAAIARFRTKVAYASLGIGALIGHLISDITGASVLTNIMASVALLGGSYLLTHVYKGGFGGGVFSFIVLSLVSRGLETWFPNAYSVLVWASVLGLTTYFLARPFFLGRLRYASQLSGGSGSAFPSLPSLSIGYKLLLIVPSVLFVLFIGNLVYQSKFKNAPDTRRLDVPSSAQVTVEAGAFHIRSAPRTNASSQGVVNKGTVLTKLGDNFGDWSKVKTLQGTIGWIHQKAFVAGGAKPATTTPRSSVEGSSEVNSINWSSLTSVSGTLERLADNGPPVTVPAAVSEAPSVMSADGVGQTASNAGAQDITPGMLAPQAPTGSDPYKSLSPPEQFRSLKATLQALEVLREGDLRATLRFENTDSNMGLALAHRAENSHGIADLWKVFPPKPIGRVTDDRGNQYSLSNQSPLGFARNANDWVVLRGGEMATHTFVFEGSSSGAPGSTFTVSMDLHVVTGPHERPDAARWTLVFTDVIP